MDARGIVFSLASFSATLMIVSAAIPVTAGVFTDVSPATISDSTQPPAPTEKPGSVGEPELRSSLGSSEVSSPPPTPGSQAGSPDDDVPSPPRPAPAPPAPPSASAEPAEPSEPPNVPPKTSNQVPTGRLISYFTNAFTYGWDTDMSTYLGTLTSVGASGSALKYPLSGAAYATCLTTQCQTRKVEVRNPTELGGGAFEATIRWKISTVDFTAKQSTVCKITTSREDIVARSCQGVRTKIVKENVS
jgi:hypothetical protein